MDSDFIPSNRPYTDHREVEAVRSVLQQSVLRGDGPVSKRVQQTLKDWLGMRHVFLTTSCTHALEMAMIVLDVEPGDEVIMPSFNFVSSANAVVLRGATVVFAEIKPDTLNLDPEDVRRRITPRTKVIVPVHYAGVSCDMDALMEIAREHDIYIVEDAAQGVDAKYKGKYLGTIGDIGCYSFHDTKNIVCGEGGAFLTNNDELARKAELVREKGTNRSAFIRGEVDKYTWVSKGSSYIQSDILSAVLEVQFAKRQEIKQKRKVVWEAYYQALSPLAEEGLLSLPVIPEGCESNYHIFFFRVADEEQRNHLLESLKNNGIGATFHYVPLHSSPFGRSVVKHTGDLPITQLCSNTLIRLPLYPQLFHSCGAVSQRTASVLKDDLRPKVVAKQGFQASAVR